MAIVREHIPVHKHFLLIDSPVPFDLIINNGTDLCHRPAGAWRVDLYHLLPEKYMKQYPGFTIDIEYDDTNLGTGQVIIKESDIDLGSGVAGVNGQEVYVTNLGEVPVINPLDSNNNKIPLDVNVVGGFFFNNLEFNSLTDFIDFLKDNSKTVNTKIKFDYKLIQFMNFNDSGNYYNAYGDFIYSSLGAFIGKILLVEVDTNLNKIDIYHTSKVNSTSIQLGTSLNQFTCSSGTFKINIGK